LGHTEGRAVIQPSGRRGALYRNDLRLRYHGIAVRVWQDKLPGGMLAAAAGTATACVPCPMRPERRKHALSRRHRTRTRVSRAPWQYSAGSVPCLWRAGSWSAWVSYWRCRTRGTRLYGFSQYPAEQEI